MTVEEEWKVIKFLFHDRNNVLVQESVRSLGDPMFMLGEKFKKNRYTQVSS